MKFLLKFAAVFAVAILASCASGGKNAQVKPIKGVPAFVNEAFLDASDDVLIGIGSYNVGGDPSKIGTGKTFAETRARADIARQLSNIVKNMVTDYAAHNELDSTAANSFQDTITQALSKVELKGAKVVKMETQDGVLWVVVSYSKSLARKEVETQADAAKLKVPQAAAFDAVKRMDEAFNKEAGGGPAL